MLGGRNWNVYLISYNAGNAEIGKFTLYRVMRGRQKSGIEPYIVMWGSRNWEVYLISCIAGKAGIGKCSLICVMRVSTGIGNVILYRVIRAMQ